MTHDRSGVPLHESQADVRCGRARREAAPVLVGDPSTQSVAGTGNPAPERRRGMPRPVRYRAAAGPVHARPEATGSATIRRYASQGGCQCDEPDPFSFSSFWSRLERVRQRLRHATTAPAPTASRPSRRPRSNGASRPQRKLVMLARSASLSVTPASSHTSSSCCARTCPLPANKLPVHGTTVNLNKAGKVLATISLAPGKNGRLSLTLKAGHYVLLCNLAAHYQSGQHAAFQVK
jgi:hypothetical protein